ncbi:hypothetical protein SporoP37_16765 (plasmid) [Sporosarcina sp. P37]|uniref:hypothetical protein n=1 Tax=Sporosarcina sp. P35 TaxID=2048246 RepID=UPI000A17FB66|nr:hypothetical protein [Sporosarcina sp. P35]ARK23671.1 hypothetical protein SporoP37_02495 [Sporosarcina sp. P37]ARK23846.1 hypothetical protein SporoP37_03450 [Sporosarcina sp. P37]ARK24934.1 hypothetical protein SporoP37_09840 [Sporosarcina sp. P37]ARK25125.1 hypothetical protein SporoP37_10985 [Sporosarcina sp. P37]ARK25964.1 hypothetical protein SporoP37_15655 [Sporosarcina sp. P37]
MPTIKPLTIVPVTLHPISSPSLPAAPASSSPGTCSVKIANAEIHFHNGVEERIIRAVMKELMHP